MARFLRGGIIRCWVRHGISRGIQWSRGSISVAFRPHQFPPQILKSQDSSGGNSSPRRKGRSRRFSYLPVALVRSFTESMPPILFFWAEARFHDFLLPVRRFRYAARAIHRPGGGAFRSPSRLMMITATRRFSYTADFR